MRSNKCIQVLLTFPPGKTKHLKIIPLLSYLNDLWMRFNCPPESLPETWCVSEQQQTNHPYSAFNFGTSPGGADLCLVSVGPDISEQHSGQSSFHLKLLLRCTDLNSELITSWAHGNAADKSHRSLRKRRKMQPKLHYFSTFLTTFSNR